MSTSINNSLLSLLLTLHRLEIPLSIDESSALAAIGEKLMYYVPDFENDIERDIMAVIQHNQTLQQLYQKSLTKILAFNGKLPPDLLPTLEELRNEIPSDTDEPVGFSHCMEVTTEDNKLEDDMESVIIFNASIKVLLTPQPGQSAKKVSKLEGIWKFLQQPIKFS